jgi:hypothetical protein
MLRINSFEIALSETSVVTPKFIKELVTSLRRRRQHKAWGEAAAKPQE